MTSNKTVNENGRKKENDIIEFSKPYAQTSS